MARDLTSAAQTEADKTSGAEFVRVLEIQWPEDSGSPTYYSTQVLDSGGSDPIDAEARVIDFPQRQVSGIPGKANAQSTMTIELNDADHAIQAKLDATPGPQTAIAYVHLWFRGTTWATDKVTEIGGILTTPMNWNSARSVITLTIRGFEYHFDRDIGFMMRHQEFPELNRQD